MPMKILFITSSRIGDAVLSTGLLSYIEQTWPQAKVTIACGHLAESLFHGYPLLDELVAMEKMRMAGHWRRLWLQVVKTRWDMVIDLRNSAVSWLIGARRRYVFGANISKNAHKVEQCAAVMNLNSVPDPKLWFSRHQKEGAQFYMGEGRGPILAVGPAANWRAKTWPLNRFIHVVRWMTKPGGVMEGARVAVFAAPGEEKIARALLETVPERYRIDMIAKTDPGTAAAALSLCDFYLGNDSGLMHCAAATGVKTLGLFGPSYDHIYRPWGEHAEFVRTPESFDELVHYPGYSADTAPCLMESLTEQMVTDKLNWMFGP